MLRPKSPLLTDSFETSLRWITYIVFFDDLRPI
eukprot:UN19334